MSLSNFGANYSYWKYNDWHVVEHREFILALMPPCRSMKLIFIRPVKSLSLAHYVTLHVVGASALAIAQSNANPLTGKSSTNLCVSVCHLPHKMLQKQHSRAFKYIRNYGLAISRLSGGQPRIGLESVKMLHRCRHILASSPWPFKIMYSFYQPAGTVSSSWIISWLPCDVQLLLSLCLHL